MKPRTLIILWLLLVGLFAAYGFFGPGHKDQLYGEPFDYRVAFESTFVFAGIGFTLATCLAACLYAFMKVRAKLITGFSAILLVMFCSTLAASIPPLLMRCSGHYQGEETVGIIIVAGYTFGIGLVGFTLFNTAILILYFRRRDA